MKYIRLEAFSGGYAQVAIGDEGFFKWGLIDRNGVEVIPTIYDSMIYLGGEYVLVNIGQYDDLENMEFVSGFWGALSVSGNRVIELKYTELHWASRESTLLIAQDGKTNMMGVIGLNENVIIPFMYSGIFPAPDNLLQVQTSDDKNGLIDFENNTVIEPIYDELNVDWREKSNTGSWIGVAKNHERYYIDYLGNRMLF